MFSDLFTICTSSNVPDLQVHVNPHYALYHLLVGEALAPVEKRDPAIAEAASAMELACSYRVFNGGWLIWDETIADCNTVEDTVERLQAEVKGSADLPWEVSELESAIEHIGNSIKMTETLFNEEIWPERIPRLEEALRTIETLLAPSFSDMAHRQAEVLSIVFPSEISAYLVTDCYVKVGGYSQPVTIDVSQHTGLQLCETLLHEATHVGDVYTNKLGKASLGKQLADYLDDEGDKYWNIWHAIIFASSARQVRECIDPDHTDYVSIRDLYSRFGVPHLPDSWGKFTGGQMNQKQFFESILG